MFEASEIIAVYNMRRQNIFSEILVQGGITI